MAEITAREWTFDEAIQRVGFGAFQRKLMIICGVGWAADAMEVLHRAHPGRLPAAHLAGRRPDPLRCGLRCRRAGSPGPGDRDQRQAPAGYGVGGRWTD